MEIIQRPEVFPWASNPGRQHRILGKHISEKQKYDFNSLKQLKICQKKYMIENTSINGTQDITGILILKLEHSKTAQCAFEYLTTAGETDELTASPAVVDLLPI
ncbi:MAG: hypothetical protein V7703_15315 [Hyphomicrobiales bacterium]